MMKDRCNPVKKTAIENKIRNQKKLGNKDQEKVVLPVRRAFHVVLTVKATAADFRV